MYFLDLQSLKRALGTTGITARASLTYLLLFMAKLLFADVQGVAFSGEFHDRWSYLETKSVVASVMILIAGTMYCYVSNGGPGGHSFLERYISLSWVVGVRVTLGALAILAPTFGAFMAVAASHEGLKNLVGPLAVVAMVSTRVFYYFRLAHHMRGLSNADRLAV